MGCGKGNTINKTYIIEPLMVGDCDIIITNFIQNCSGTTSITLYDNLIAFSGDTYFNGGVTASTISADAFYSGGTNLLDIINSSDTYPTGGTYNSLTQSIDFSGFTNNNSFSVDVSPLLDDTNIYLTAFTYDNQNNLTIFRSDGASFGVNVSEMTGLTVNGNIIVTGITDLNIVSANTAHIGTIETVDYIQFNTGYTGNTIVEGRIYWDEDNGTLSLGMHGGNVHQQIGEEIFYYIKNQSGATIENGRVVRAAGTLGASGKILGEYMIGDGSIPPKFTLGIATENIANGDEGYVTEFGLVRGIDTTGAQYGETWSDGNILWVHPTINGGLTNIHPVAPDLHVEMAIVINSSNNGSIFVRPHRYPNFHDLQESGWSAGTENNLDVIQWNGTTNLFELTNTPFFDALSATTISGDTYYGDGSNLTGIDNFYSTASTLVGDVVYFDRTDQLSAYTLNLSGFSTSDIYITGGTFDNSTSILTLGRNDAFDITITGFTDLVTTGVTLINNIAYFDTNSTLSAYTLDLTTLAPTGGTGTDFYTTGITQEGNTLYYHRNDTLSAYSITLTGLTGTGGTSVSTGQTIQFMGARGKANQNNIFMRYDDGSPYNVNPYRLYGDFTITNVVASGRDLDTWDAHILTGTSIATDSIYHLKVNASRDAYDTPNLDVYSGNTLYLYMSGTSISYPRIDVYLKNQ